MTTHSRIPEFPAILSIHDLMQALQLTNTDLSILLKDESFPIVSVGNQRYVLRDSLMEWLKAQECRRINSVKEGTDDGA